MQDLIAWQELANLQEHHSTNLEHLQQKWKSICMQTDDSLNSVIHGQGSLGQEVLVKQLAKSTDVCLAIAVQVVDGTSTH